MKINIQKTKNRFISILGAVVVFVSCVAVPAFAVDANGNEFINFDDYANYSFTADNSRVEVECTFPDVWNTTYYFGGDNWERFLGKAVGNEFTFADTSYYSICLRMHPLGGNTGVGDYVGYQVENAHFIDLRYIPEGAELSYRFNFYLEEDDIVNSEKSYYRYIYYVDENGKSVKCETTCLVPEMTPQYFGDVVIGYNYTWTETIKLENLPENAVGFVPMFLFKNAWVYEIKATVTLDSFRLSFPISAIQYESQQNERLQDTMENVQKALEEQNKKADDLINGTPEQNQQIGDSVGSLNNKTDELGELGNQLNSIEKPKINTSDFSATALVPGTSLKVLAMPFQALWENEILLAILTVVVSLVLVSWVFFGKKR